MKSIGSSFVFALALAIPTSGVAAGPGYFGFTLHVDSEGFVLNPTIKSLKVLKVMPSSPSASAGMRAGDEIIEVAGRVVVGAKAKELQSLAKKEAGQSLTLRVKHAEGEVVALTMVAVEKPESN